MPGYGWVGKLLRVDLTSRKIVIDPSGPVVERFIGGRGVGQWLVFNHLKSGVDALSPDNIIVFGTGPLTGTMAPASRMSVDSKNVYTNGVLSSNVGGHIGPELKYAGFDFLVVHGASKKPVYLLVTDGGVEFRDASHLWGESTWRTEDILRKDLVIHGYGLLQSGFLERTWRSLPVSLLIKLGLLAGAAQVL